MRTCGGQGTQKRKGERRGLFLCGGISLCGQKVRYQYHGPIPLYEKHGFRMIAEKEWFCIMQKKL
ncbi:MAG: hypothetical protein HFH94_16165 [Lachnospiraceae bacterium]|nr:hypothetical protein [Lachnospiraceae bacterium]